MDKSFMLRHRQDKNKDTFSKSFTDDIEKGKNITGGKWSKDYSGTSIFSPYKRMLDKHGADAFSRYFSKERPNVILDLSQYGLGNGDNIKGIK